MSHPDIINFNTLFFSEEDIHNIIEELKIDQNKKNYIPEKQNIKKESRTHFIFSKPSNEWRTADGGIEPIRANNVRKIDNRDFLNDGSSISNYNTSKYSNNKKSR